MLAPGEIANKDDLIARILYTQKKSSKSIVLLTGSGVSLPGEGSTYGVPGTAGMLDLIAHELGEPSKSSEAAPHKNYPSQFSRLLNRTGHEGARSVVQKAVLKCLPSAPSDDSYPLTNDQCSQLEEQISDWIIPEPHNHLAELLTTATSPFKPLILTSNFDPLHEIGLSRANSQYYSTILDQDGIPSQSHGRGVHVIHFHGYWYGGDTLHTDRQLRMDRPRLKASLQQYLRDTIILVIGYGGWNDIVSETISETISDPSYNTQLLWCFHGTNNEAICNSNVDLFDRFKDSIHQGRARFYSGIDCIDIFKKIHNEIISAKKLSESSLPSNLAPTPLSEDTPPYVTHWVGRESELNSLKYSSARVISITGTGGQGKSFLAANHFESEKSQKKKAYNQFAWFDLREEGDTLLSKIFIALKSLSLTKAEEIAQTSGEELVALFCSFLARSSCLIVLDNVDHYIDLESGNPSGYLHTLLTSYLNSGGNSRIVLTCRPSITLGQIGVDHIRLEAGLSIEETQSLFEFMGAKLSDLTLYRELQTLTKGHPLWLSFIANQSKTDAEYSKKVLSARGIPEEKLAQNLFKSASDRLNKNQRQLLFSIAALPKAIPESTLYELTSSELNYNRFTKSLKALDMMSFIVNRQSEGERILDLHPLVRLHARQLYRSELAKDQSTAIGLEVAKLIDKRLRTTMSSGSIKILTQQEIELISIEGDLLIDAGAPLQCLSHINNKRLQLIASGSVGEYFRLTKKSLDTIPNSSNEEKSTIFTQAISDLVSDLSQYKEFDEASRYLERYHDSIDGMSAGYINFCSLKSEHHRLKNELSMAIEWGQKGKELKEKSNADTQFSAEHNWALATRDAGQVEEALPVFLHGLQLNEVLSEDFQFNLDLDQASFFGNLGRCLQLQGDFDAANLLYRRSLNQLLDRRMANFHMTNVNLGYAHQWIGETFYSEDNRAMAYSFFILAKDYWDTSAPALAQKSENYISEALSSSEPAESMAYVSQDLVDARRARKVWLTEGSL